MIGTVMNAMNTKMTSQDLMPIVVIGHVRIVVIQRKSGKVKSYLITMMILAMTMRMRKCHFAVQLVADHTQTA